MTSSPPHQRVACVSQYADVNALLRMVLATEGYSLVSVVGEQDEYLHHALELLPPLTPEVAIVSLRCPPVRYWYSFERLTDALPDCRFIVLTADPSALREINHRPYLEYDIVPMPFDVDELVARVRAALSSPAGAPAGDERQHRRVTTTYAGNYSCTNGTLKQTLKH